MSQILVNRRARREMNLNETSGQQLMSNTPPLRISASSAVKEPDFVQPQSTQRNELE
jgi:hypothetical protein